MTDAASMDNRVFDSYQKLRCNLATLTKGTISSDLTMLVTDLFPYDRRKT